MPWRKFVSDWIEALTSPSGSLKVSSVGRESESGTLVCKVEDFDPTANGAQPVSLRFPDGQMVKRPPLWTRLSETCGSILLALKADCQHELQLLDRVSNTRRSPRIPARLWTLFLDGPCTGALTLDLSLEGCRVEGDFRSFVGTEVSLSLELGNSPEPLYLKARFVWAQQNQAGLRFVNLHVFDEVKLMRATGQVSAVPPSNFLPLSGNGKKLYEYALTPAQSGRWELEIVAANWCFRIELESVTSKGAARGTFDRFQLLDSSLPLQRLRARQKVCLNRPKRFLHLLLCSKGETVLDVLGEEVEFARFPREENSSKEAV